MTLHFVSLAVSGFPDNIDVLEELLVPGGCDPTKLVLCIGRKNCESNEDLEAATDFMDDDKATQVLEGLIGPAETDSVFSKIKSLICFRPRLLDIFLVSVTKSLVIIVDVVSSLSSLSSVTTSMMCFREILGVDLVILDCRETGTKGAGWLFCFIRGYVK